MRACPRSRVEAERTRLTRCPPAPLLSSAVHRIGRTGRAGATGTAHTLFTPLDKAHSGELVNILNEASAVVPPELLKFGTHVKKKEHGLYGAHFKAVETVGGAPVAAKRMTFD